MEKILCKYIKYKFIFDEKVNKSSYIYQKVFRSIYGYYQSIYKKNSKKYLYFREGVLSNIPYIKPGKNSIIVPNGYEKQLVDYFNTGINPAHNWRIKGNWKVDYTINNVYLDVDNIYISMEKFIKNYNILSNNFKTYNNMELELKKAFDNNSFEKDYISYLIKKIEYLFNFDWINKSLDCSEYIKELFNKYELLKEKAISFSQ